MEQAGDSWPEQLVVVQWSRFVVAMFHYCLMVVALGVAIGSDLNFGSTWARLLRVRTAGQCVPAVRDDGDRGRTEDLAFPSDVGRFFQSCFR